LRRAAAAWAQVSGPWAGGLRRKPSAAEGERDEKRGETKPAKFFTVTPLSWFRKTRTLRIIGLVSRIAAGACVIFASWPGRARDISDCAAGRENPVSASRSGSGGERRGAPRRGRPGQAALGGREIRAPGGWARGTPKFHRQRAVKKLPGAGAIAARDSAQRCRGFSFEDRGWGRRRARRKQGPPRGGVGGAVFRWPASHMVEDDGVFLGHAAGKAIEHCWRAAGSPARAAARTRIRLPRGSQAGEREGVVQGGGSFKPAARVPAIKTTRSREVPCSPSSRCAPSVAMKDVPPKHTR